VATFVILKVIGVITGLRVDELEERQGLDIHSHNERGYDL
jgi:Amt family ammonium transporter